MSELAQVASHMRVRFLPDGGAVLTNPDGTDHTQPRAFAPLPAFTKEQRESGDDVRILLQWQADSYPAFDGSVYVDGQHYGTIGNEDRALWLTTKNGILEPEGQPPMAPIIVPAIKPATVTGGDWALRIDEIPSGRQAQFYTQGVGAGGTITLDVPAGKGRVRGTERAGTTVTTRHVKQTCGSEIVMDQDTGTSVDGIALNETQRSLIQITAPGYDGTLGYADMSLIVDWNKG